MNSKLRVPTKWVRNSELKGLGVDLVEVERIESAVTKWGQRFLEKVFTPAELNYCLSRARPAEHLAARFAGKEAVIKALGLRCPWKDIEIRRGNTGKPAVHLEGKAKELAGQGHILITLTHTAQLALAQAVYIADCGLRIAD
ncbi:MAG: holo-ACP synthase [bacterium]